MLADVGAKEVLKWEKLEAKWAVFLPVFSLLTEIGGQCSRDAFLCAQQGNTEGPDDLGEPVPTWHLRAMQPALLYGHGFSEPSSGLLLEEGLTGGPKCH